MRSKLRPPPSVVLAKLSNKYGFPKHGNPPDVFFCAVYVLLSAQTTLEQARTAFRSIKRRWSTAEELSRARRSAVESAIESCGFGRTRSAKVVALAQAVASRAKPLSSLRLVSDDEVEAELVALPGIGVKTARVVAAMSALRRHRFAVDTHVWRIAHRLGWTRGTAIDRKPTQREADELEGSIPKRNRRQLHACLVALGRDRCQRRHPLCSGCVLQKLCAHADA